MHEYQRDSVGDSAPLVDIMDVERAEALDLDIPRELRELVYLSLGLTPAVPILPASNETLDIREGRAVLAPSVLELVGKPHEIEFLVQQLNIGIRDVQFERLFRHDNQYVCSK